MIHKHPRRDGHPVYDQPFETTAHTVLPCGKQPASPMHSDVTKLLAQHQGGVHYPAGSIWVQTPGKVDVEPGIDPADVQWSANPVAHLNPLVADYMSAPPRIA